ncbi:MAG: UbiA family prenyltransferase, partial [Dehalococcoidia bacterium]|nr:UbiA family prenyltransferase [Dehalococcoidia bacterium]
MVVGAYFVQARVFDMAALWLSLPVGLAVTAILAANDLRDLEEDRHAGKLTPVTLLGRGFGRVEWVFLVAAAFLAVIALSIVGAVGLTALFSLLALPQGWKTLRMIVSGQDRAGLAAALPSSSRLHWHLGLLLAAGVALGRFIPL